MQKRILISSIVGILTVGGFALTARGKSPATPASHSPVAVELFTSQGCSSCPSADALIGRLAREPGVIAISRPVTYWDRRGWRDTLARESNTTLRRSYVARGVDSKVLTPQVVVRRQFSAIGSDERAVRRLIAQAPGGAGPAITIKSGTALFAANQGAK